MKIATYNLRNLYDADTFVSEESENAVTEEIFNRRVSHFTEIFRKLDLDIICLQEVGGEKGISIIGETLGYNYFFSNPNKRGIRLAVLYKKSLPSSIVCGSVSLGELSIPSIKEKGDTDNLCRIANRRDILVIDIDNHNNKKLRIVTFHLKSLLPEFLELDDRENDSKAYADAKFRSVLYKMLELRALRDFADKSINEGREVVLLGDFNEHNNGSGLDILKASNKEENSLSDILVNYKGDKNTLIHNDNGLTFDTMLVSSKMFASLVNVSIENQDLKCYSNIPLDEEITESDHAMVWAEFK